MRSMLRTVPPLKNACVMPDLIHKLTATDPVIWTVCITARWPCLGVRGNKYSHCKSGLTTNAAVAKALWLPTIPSSRRRKSETFRFAIALKWVFIRLYLHS